MALSAGERLGPYEIRELLGAGGMGEVYRARDSKLGRDVAIKVLPEEFSQDSKRLARFKREAQLLAALNHPNIAAIHGLEESGATLYLVLELVPGETLAARLSKGRLTVEEALRIATQVAEALEEAHEKGIIHRDLKPGNIMITEDGKVKVLDFGLARAFAEDTPEADSSLSPTLTRDGTRAGVILGTAAYMSPEQARGRKLDKRSNIFSFGAVLYEMLSGKKAFSGEDVSDILASVIKLEPDWVALPDALDPRIERLLRRCVEKDRKKRRRDIGDVRNEIEEALATPERGRAVLPVAKWRPTAGLGRRHCRPSGGDWRNRSHAVASGGAAGDTILHLARGSNHSWPPHVGHLSRRTNDRLFREQTTPPEKHGPVGNDSDAGNGWSQKHCFLARRPVDRVLVRRPQEGAGGRRDSGEPLCCFEPGGSELGGRHHLFRRTNKRHLPCAS